MRYACIDHMIQVRKQDKGRGKALQSALRQKAPKANSSLSGKPYMTVRKPKFTAIESDCSARVRSSAFQIITAETSVTCFVRNAIISLFCMKSIFRDRSRYD